MPNYTLVDGWILRETVYKPEEESSRATVFALANGYMGVRGAGEELPADTPGVKGCYVNGVYDTPSGKLTEREIVCVQDWTAIRLSVDGEPFDLTTGTLSEYCRELDMRRATMRRMIRWTSPGGKTVIVESERFLPMVLVRMTGVIRYRITAEQDSEIEVGSGIEGDVNNRWADHFKAWHPQPNFLETETFDPGHRIGVTIQEELDGENAEPRVGGHRTENVYRFRLGAGQTATLTKWAAVVSRQLSETSPLEPTVDMLAKAREKGYDGLLSEHVANWQKLWDRCDVVIEGDEKAQMGMRFSLFHLLAAGPSGYSDRISVPARGLQGQDYYGSVFWDCDIFVLPFFTYTVPWVANNCIRYRAHTLDGARRKAKSLGYKGAFYAWQSQETGDEQCDLYVFTDPVTGEPVRSYFADEQIHISADIIYAAEQAREIGGGDFGTSIPYYEVARFFISRATYNEERDRCELRTVLGPDEYHERVDNNAFTNVMAAEAIHYAIERAVPNPDDVHPRERDRWQEFLAKLYIPQPDPITKLIPQFDGYFDLPDVPLEETLREFEKPENRFAGVDSPFAHSQNIKQADVMMLLYLFRDRYDMETKRANWEYYEPRTSHLSSLSPMAYSLVAADIGKLDWAYKYFLYTSHIDLESYGPHWNQGIHAASLGGAWMAVVHGFCRMTLKRDGIHFSQWPALPEQWKSVEVPFCICGRRMKLRTDGRSLELTDLAVREALSPFGDPETLPPWKPERGDWKSSPAFRFPFPCADVPVFFPDGEASVAHGETLQRVWA